MGLNHLLTGMILQEVGLLQHVPLKYYQKTGWIHHHFKPTKPVIFWKNPTGKNRFNDSRANCYNSKKHECFGHYWRDFPYFSPPFGVTTTRRVWGRDEICRTNDVFVVFFPGRVLVNGRFFRPSAQVERDQSPTNRPTIHRPALPWCLYDSLPHGNQNQGKINRLINFKFT